MTIVLLALLIAGHHFQWYWLIGAVVLDIFWLSIKLNFLTVLIRRSIEASKYEMEEDPAPPAPPTA